MNRLLKAQRKAKETPRINSPHRPPTASMAPDTAMTGPRLAHAAIAAAAKQLYRCGAGHSRMWLWALIAIGLLLADCERTLATEDTGSGEPAGEAPPALMRISRRLAAPAVTPLLVEAYDAYQSSDYEQARHGYRQVLQHNSRHRGATLGLAAVALQQGEPELAHALYLRLLERDPRDPLAHAALTSIAPDAGSAAQESRLELLLTAHPDAAPLRLALGNLYAAEQRWHEAQQAYFAALQAARAAPATASDPAYPFNLAVTLEQLANVPQALTYYREALLLARRSGTEGALSPERIEQRLAELSPE